MELLNPFFQMMSPSVCHLTMILFVPAGATISQTLITGTLTMVSEATHLNWMPHPQVRYPVRMCG